MTDIETKQLKKIADGLCRKFNQPERLELAVGAKVQLRVNLSSQLVNGSAGTIVKFEDDLPIVEFENGLVKCIQPFEWTSEFKEVQVVLTQIPLMLAWASTIHMAQGKSLDHICASVAGAFECGQVYVALSRVRSAEGLQLMSFRPKSIKCDPIVRAFYHRFE